MTTHDKELQRLADRFMRVMKRMGELRNASRTCPLSDCRRERRCVGADVRCMVPVMPKGEFTLPVEDVREWKELLLQRRDLLAAITRLSEAAPA